MKKAILIFAFLLIYQPFYAQNATLALNARAAALANTSLTLQDAWAVFNNIGALAWNDKNEVLFAYDNRFGLSGWHNVAAGAVVRTNFGLATGVTVSRFGDNLFNRTQIGFGASHKLGIASLGAKANYVQLFLDGLGIRRLLAFEFGGVMQLTKQLTVGAHIFNFNQAKIANFQDERLPSVMRAGVSYRPTKSLMVNIEAEKDLILAPNVKAGVEYKLVEKITIRTGINAKPLAGSFGIGFQLSRLVVDYALQTHSQLPTSQFLSIAYQFKKNEKK